MNDRFLPIETPVSTGDSSQNVLESAVDAWFLQNGWSVFDFQREVWAAYARGGSGLIHSATGSGKTLAAWLAAVIAHTGRPGETLPLTVLWITPMRALAHD
ncbi:MAG: DEAD/DEAH box helicase, partial [Burkholderiales bacterium]